MTTEMYEDLGYTCWEQAKLNETATMFQNGVKEREKTLGRTNRSTLKRPLNVQTAGLTAS